MQQFIYRGDQLVGEIDSTGKLKSRFFYEVGRTSPIFSWSSRFNGLFVSIHQRSTRSPVMVVDTQTGSVLMNASYDAWGNVTYMPGTSGVTNQGVIPFGFAGVVCTYSGYGSDAVWGSGL